MPGRQARILTPAVVRRVQSNLSKRGTYERDLAIFMLSFRAGLRACEIAQLDWSMLTKSDGRLGEVISVRDNIAKMGSGRTIPIHAELKAALRPMFKRDQTGPVIRSVVSGRALRPNSIVNWSSNYTGKLDLLAALHIAAEGPLSPMQLATHTDPVPPFVTYSC